MCIRDSTKVGEILQLTAQVLPENATDKKVIWNSSNTEAAQVDESGMVTAVANGTTIITAATEDQRLTAECEIRVNIPVRVEGVKLNQNTAQFTRPGETLQLMAEVYPAQADCTEVSYSSTDASVAAVNENGVVTAGKNGQAVIMVTTQDGRYVEMCIRDRSGALLRICCSQISRCRTWTVLNCQGLCFTIIRIQKS